MNLIEKQAGIACLKRALELLKIEGAWTQGEHLQNAAREPLAYDEPVRLAKHYTILGAIMISGEESGGRGGTNAIYLLTRYCHLMDGPCINVTALNSLPWMCEWGATRVVTAAILLAEETVQPKLAVIIGRFQPFHIGHEAMVRHALSIAEYVVVFAGGFAGGQSPKNPYSFHQREVMVRNTMQSDRIIVVPVMDRNSDEEWKDVIEAHVKRLYGTYFPEDKDYDVALVGHEKDSSSYYLKLFDAWQFIQAPVFHTRGGTVLSASDIREAMLTGESVESVLPEGTKSALVGHGPYRALDYIVDHWEGFEREIMVHTGHLIYGIPLEGSFP